MLFFTGGQAGRRFASQRAHESAHGRTHGGRLGAFARNALTGRIFQRVERGPAPNPLEAGPELTHPRNRAAQIQRQHAVQEIGELKKALNQNLLRALSILKTSRLLSEKENKAILARRKEITETFQIIYQGIEEGKIRGPADVEKFMQNWFFELCQKNPQFGQQLMGKQFRTVPDAIRSHSKKAATSFARSFDKRSTKEMNRIFQRLAVIARGGDPYE